MVVEAFENLSGAAADEWNRVHDLMVKRHDLRMQGVDMHELLKQTKTGYSFLDDPERYAFSKLGDGLRADMRAAAVARYFLGERFRELLLVFEFAREWPSEA